MDAHPKFHVRVANSQLGKQLATATLKFDIGDNTFAEHFVVINNLIGPILGFHSMRHHRVVIDT